MGVAHKVVDTPLEALVLGLPPGSLQHLRGEVEANGPFDVGKPRQLDREVASARGDVQGRAGHCTGGHARRCATPRVVAPPGHGGVQQIVAPCYPVEHAPDVPGALRSLQVGQMTPPLAGSGTRLAARSAPQLHDRRRQGGQEVAGQHTGVAHLVAHPLAGQAVKVDA